MIRDEAIDIIVADEIKHIDLDERYSLLLDWWVIDDEDEEYNELPQALRAEIDNTDEPLDRSTDEKYVPLLLIGLRARLKGVTNKWLSKCVTKLTGKVVQVEGVCEVLATCPCCGYRTLLKRGDYEICKVCFWEDDGSNDPQHYSSPNHMTLADGCAKYQKFGVVAERFRGVVASDANERYELGNSSSGE